MNGNHSDLINLYLPKVTEYDDRYDKSSVEEVMKAASEGDAAAIYELASRYRLGVDGVEQDPAMAVRLYKEVLKQQNNVSAFYHIGYLTLDGALGDDALMDGFPYLEAAYSLGDPGAAIQLGIQNEFGELIPQDLGKALKFYTFALAHGRTDAAYHIGEAYLRMDNAAEARKYYEMALADEGWKEDAEQRIALLDRIEAEIVDCVGRAKGALSDGKVIDAANIITEGYKNLPNDPRILYELVNIDDIVLHGLYCGGNLNANHENMCRMLLDHIDTLKRQSFGNPNFLRKSESDVRFFFASIFIEREQMDEAADLLSGCNVSDTPMAAYAIFMTHVYDIDNHVYDLCGDVQMFETAITSSNWPNNAQKALAYTALSSLYASGAPNVPKDVARGYENARKGAELSQDVGGPELAKYRKDFLGRITYNA